MTLNERLGAIYRSTDEEGGGFVDPALSHFEHDEIDQNDQHVEPDRPSSGATAATEPPEWFSSFANDIAGKIGQLEQRFQPPRQEQTGTDEYNPWQEDPAFRQIDQRINETHSSGMRMMGEMMRPVVESQLVGSLAEGLGAEAQDYIRTELRGMDPITMVNLSRNPQALRMLKFAAQGYAAGKKPPTTQAPQTEQVKNNSSNLDSEAEKEIDAYMRAFGRHGATRQMAIEAYKRATGGR